MPSNKKPTKEHVQELERRWHEVGHGTVEEAQIQAELEDIEDGHWDGPRTDITKAEYPFR